MHIFIEQQYSNTLQKWTKELGKTYGYFEGSEKTV